MTRRITVGVLVFGLSALAVTTQQPTPAAAQKVNPQVVQLQQQNQLLQQQNQQLKQQLQQAHADLKAAKGETDKAKKDDKKDSKAATDAQAVVDRYKNAGLVHVVILKLKSDSSDADVKALIDDTNSQLAKIKGVRGVWAGKPSDSGTPDVAKTDYTVALAFVFDDAAGLKKYIDDPVHKKFVDKHLKKWETPVVYDFEPKKKGAP